MTKKVIIGIRREDKNKWECRCPLQPSHVYKLLRALGDSLEIRIEPCNKRVFSDEEFIKSGAIIDNDELQSCEIILGVKEIPLDKIQQNKTYFLFSHSHKGQEHNLKFLSKYRKNNCTLIDYELLAEPKSGKRTVAFGLFAGYAGFVNALCGVGDRLLLKGYRSPFLNISLANHYSSLNSARKAVKKVGKLFGAAGGLHPDLGPMIFVFTGNGNVSQGAQEIFELLPHKYVNFEELPQILTDPQQYKRNVCYGCVIEAKDYIQKDEHGNFDYNDFKNNPKNYTSDFHEIILPYASCIINGIYWDPKFPRLVTNEQLRTKFLENQLRLISIADITCDPNGSIECMDRITKIEEPFYIWDPVGMKHRHGDFVDGIQVMSIDNLPTQFAAEASEYFSEAFYPLLKSYVESIANEDFSAPRSLEKATILANGQFMPGHRWLLPIVERASTTKYDVIVFGSGMIAGPCIEYLVQKKQFHLKCITNCMEEFDKHILCRETKLKIDLNYCDVENIDQDSLIEIVSECKIVISLLPASMHIILAKACLQAKKNMVTASYISKEMEELSTEVAENNLIFMNEVGLDPGLDHITAFSMINDLKARKKRIKSFESWCGGLPSIECSDNPFGYKFSWSPRGALLALLNEAMFLRNGNTVNVESKNLLLQSKAVEVPHKGFAFEGYPNRDSTRYIKKYGLESATTVLRGTLRYAGFCRLMFCFAELGFLSDAPFDTSISNWKQFLASRTIEPQPHLYSSVWKRFGKHITKEEAKSFCIALEWLEMFDDEDYFKISSNQITTTFSEFCSLLQKKLRYKEDETDLVYLMHRIRVEDEEEILPLQSSQVSEDYAIETATQIDAAMTQAAIACADEEYVMTLMMEGSVDGYSAMAQTVGIPVALAACQLLEVAERTSERVVSTPPLTSTDEEQSEQLPIFGVLHPLADSSFCEGLLDKIKQEGSITLKIIKNNCIN